jgi:hypothetical protein
LEFCVPDGVLVSSAVSCAHLLAFFMPFAQNSDCVCILGMCGNATRTKYVGLAIKTDRTSG